ncbi:UNVERIFIED_CONTAM: hypothetical protein GTU68_034058 [Idotea baltica]|nr:hypothetical protein [Idotea baltica]
MDNASSSQDIPDEPSVQQWINAALSNQKGEAELSIRVVDEAESSELNLRYRNKDLSESLQELLLEESLQLPLLGDLVICAPVVEHEAQQQKKSLKAHWAHMLVHGSLHLIGYDHMNDQEAELMEQLETNILTNLGFPPPYEQPPGAIDT